MAARYWRTISTLSPPSSTGTTTTAPGWWTTSRSKVASRRVLEDGLGGGDQRPGVDDPFSELAEPAQLTCVDLEQPGGLRPSARARAAATNARNRGWGRSGRLLNSGWAWVPTQNGWPSSSTNSTSRSSGDVPDRPQPGLLQPPPVAGVELVAVPVALVDEGLAVGLGHLGAGPQPGRVDAEAHGAADSRRPRAARP